MNIPLPHNRPPRILITRADKIGDFILSTPVFQAIREKWPQAYVAALTFTENRDLAEGNPYLDEVILYDKKGRQKGWLGGIFFARKIAQKKFDLVIHLHATNRMHWMSWLAQIPVRIGYKRKMAKLLTHAFEDGKKEGLKHEAEYNFELLKPFHIQPPEQWQFFLPLQKRAGQSLDALMKHESVPADRPWLVFHLSASCPSKRWPPERFGRVAHHFAEKYSPVIFIVGSRADRSLAMQCQQAAGIPMYDLSGRLSLGMLAHLLKRSALLISNDSGPVHMAAALEIPVVSIFGRKQAGLSPDRWKPLSRFNRVIWKDAGCDICLAHRCQIQFLCLDVISESDVFTAAEELWNLTPSRSSV